VTGIEAIQDGDHVIAYVISATATASSTQFMTSDDATFQAGFVVYGGGNRVPAHVHLPVARSVVGTSELLIVRSGRCIVDMYAADRRMIASRELAVGDAVLSLGGGHGFRMLEDTVLLEIKQGPYGGVAEKERFETAEDGQPL
jgi:hypothetical protein